jgi:DNA-binding NarL/FixJ family response regulator
LQYSARMRVTTATAGSGDNLSRREREVVQLLAEGLTVREVARTLEISMNTARGYVQSILRKLGLYTRSQLVDWYLNAREW